MDPYYNVLVNKIREPQKEEKKLNVTDYYSRLRSKENQMNGQSDKFSKVVHHDKVNIQIRVVGRLKYKAKFQPTSRFKARERLEGNSN